MAVLLAIPAMLTGSNDGAATGRVTNYPGFTCDVPAGMFEMRQGPLVGQGKRVTGTLEVKDIVSDARWRALANVYFIEPELEIMFGLRVQVQRVGSAGSSQIMVAKFFVKHGSDISQSVIGRIPVAGDGIDFAIETSRSGDVLVKLGDLKMESRAASEMPSTSRFSLSCSTGKFEFRDVETVVY